MGNGTTKSLYSNPTTADIARVAGVSLATVDRVLNGRSGVRSATIERVNKAIEELGYIRDTAAASLARRHFYRFLFILPETENEFVLALEDALSSQFLNLRHQRVGISKKTTPPFDSNALVGQIDQVDPKETDGIAVFGPETPGVRDAVRRAKDRGLSVVALVADLPNGPRDHYVGIDNFAAGRTAATLMGRFVRGEGKILVLTGSRIARDHLERRSGFDMIMERNFPGLEVIATIEGQDDPDLVRALLPAIFESHDDILGIYSSAAGNLGLVTFLEDTGRSKDLTVIAHELTPLSRSALSDGTFDAIISQDTGHLIRSAVRLLKAEVDKTPVDKTQERIRIDIYLRENMPAATE
ncbi:MAG: LacI family DNA-binding transcriptional regulator [Pseudomonadota bacterium]